MNKANSFVSALFSGTWANTSNFMVRSQKSVKITISPVNMVICQDNAKLTTRAPAAAKVTSTICSDLVAPRF